MSDKQLIKQLKNRDRNALKEVYNDYRREFFKFANRYETDQSTLEDIFQDALIALYEHRTFVQSVIWDIDCFDQWGVELGKQIGNEILPKLLGESEDGSAGDSATDNLIRLFRDRSGT